MSSLTERLEAHARLHDALYPPDEEQAEWAADLREAIDAIRERDELAKQRGELAARVIELQAALRDIEAAATYSPCRGMGAWEGVWDDALAKLIQRHARLLPPAPEQSPTVNVASDSSTGAKTE
jgi:hypothetical protein